MCGIAGFIGEDRERIERMVHALRHRGPDGQATELLRGASFGHARLAILDPRPEGDQPMWNADRTVCIVFNGEIFNYRHLKESGKLDCRTGTDTEVLLKLYERHGMSFVSRLRGMFAFGLYDTRNQTLHLARDASGIKPLYLTYVDGKPHFASEVRSLCAGLPRQPSLNMRALSLYVRLQYVPGPETLIDGITQLPPGTVMSWKDGHESRTRFEPEAEEPQWRSLGDTVEQLPTLMDSAVEEHLISDRPVGLFLSGGMDSSIMLHHMQNHAARPIKTFTVRFEATEAEGAAKFNADADLAKLTAAHYGTDHQEILVTAEDFRNHYRETARALDLPNANSIAIAQLLLARAAKKHVDVALTGNGGDELFGGYARYRITSALHHLRVIPPSVRRMMGSVMGVSPDLPGMSPGPLLAERLLARSEAEGTRITRGTWFNAAATSQLFEERWHAAQQPHPVRTLMEMDRTLWLPDEALKMADATSMASGLECRVPLLDPRIIAAAQACRTGWHLDPWHTKKLLKRIYHPLLPPHLRSLKKAGFFPPFAKWLRREAGPLMEEALENRRIRELFNVDALRQLYADHCSQKTYALHPLQTVIQLAAWFDEVYDARPGA